MITFGDYPGEQVVPFRIRYVNLGEKVLKHKGGRCCSKRRCENSVIHRGSGRHLHSATLRADRIFPGTAARSKLRVNESSEHTRFSTSRNRFGQSRRRKVTEATPYQCGGWGWACSAAWRFALRRAGGGQVGDDTGSCHLT